MSKIKTYEPCRIGAHPDCVSRADEETLEDIDIAPQCKCRCHVDNFVAKVADMLLTSEEANTRLIAAAPALLAALKWIEIYISNQPLDSQAQFLITKKVHDATKEAE